jgi:hypothetical protein
LDRTTTWLLPRISSRSSRTCKLHGIEAEDYLTEVIRIMPYWLRDRYLELAPRYWRETRANLGSKELERPVGPITVPPPASGAKE